MKDIDDKSIDLLLTDPPYKMNHTTGSTTGSGFKERWNGNLYAGDKSLVFDTDIKFSSWLPDIYRALKDKAHCYIFCNDKNLEEMMCESRKVGFRLSNILVWHKNNCTPNRYYMKNCEFILFLYKGKAKPINKMGSKCVVSIDNISGKNKLHPTEKPIPLLELLVENSTNEGETVLDLFAGSGSTAMACINTNRNFIGIEKDENYYNIANKRIEDIKE